jgi:membrane-associated protease RseP (regulator of RpoE activity)
MTSRIVRIAARLFPLVAAVLLGPPSRAETIPLRDPVAGESRPAWWMSCWADHVVVIKGMMRFEVHDPPDLALRISPGALQTNFPQAKDKKLLEHFSYHVATITLDELVFASPGVDLLNSQFAAMREGKIKSTRALVPSFQFDDRPPFFLNVEPAVDNKGVFIFRYYDLLPGISLVFDGVIPDDRLPDATAVFEYRGTWDYHAHSPGHQPFRAEKEEGVVGILLSPQDFPKITMVRSDSPAAKSGIRAGDYILAINEHQTSQMSLAEFQRQAAGTPGSVVEFVIKRANTGKIEQFQLQRGRPD